VQGREESTAGFHDQVKEAKRRIIRNALDQAGGVKGAAAERLGIPLSSLSRLMTNLGMR
jgi:DNA-binding NtrC family response regulator